MGAQVERMRKQQRTVAVLNLVFGMLIPVLLIIVLGIVNSSENVVVGFFFGMCGFIACLALVWWRIRRVYQVIE